MTVLLVDDNPQALGMISSVFHGFGVREQIKCASAVDAVRVIQWVWIASVRAAITTSTDPLPAGHRFRWLTRPMLLGFALGGVALAGYLATISS